MLYTTTFPPSSEIAKSNGHEVNDQARSTAWPTKFLIRVRALVLLLITRTLHAFLPETRKIQYWLGQEGNGQLTVQNVRKIRSIFVNGDQTAFVDFRFPTIIDYGTTANLKSSFLTAD